MIKTKTIILSLLVVLTFGSCNYEEDAKLKINPLDNLVQVDQLLSAHAEKTQMLSAPTNKKSKITGKKGTIIHIDPARLETLDGSPLGDKIDVELLELSEKSNLITNNAPTVSNGKLLVTGGAYYLNMTSDGKQLKMKKGKGMNVEFPKLSNDEMGLFLGERDEFGQINWIATKDKFVPKDIANGAAPLKATVPAATPAKGDVGDVNKGSGADSSDYDGDELAAIIDYVNDSKPSAPKQLKKEEVSEEEYERYQKSVRVYEEEQKKYLREKELYEASQKQIAYQRKTYEAVEVMNFGWINCDRFYDSKEPLTDIKLLVENDSITGARFYAIFTDSRSMLTSQYWNWQKGTSAFNGIPEGLEIEVLALSAKDGIPYVFEKTINTSKDKTIQVSFTATTQKEIKRILKRLN